MPIITIKQITTQLKQNILIFRDDDCLHIRQQELVDIKEYIESVLAISSEKLRLQVSESSLFYLERETKFIARILAYAKQFAIDQKYELLEQVQQKFTIWRQHLKKQQQSEQKKISSIESKIDHTVKCKATHAHNKLIKFTAPSQAIASALRDQLATLCNHFAHSAKGTCDLDEVRKQTIQENLNDIIQSDLSNDDLNNLQTIINKLTTEFGNNTIVIEGIKRLLRYLQVLAKNNDYRFNEFNPAFLSTSQQANQKQVVILSTKLFETVTLLAVHADIKWSGRAYDELTTYFNVIIKTGTVGHSEIFGLLTCCTELAQFANADKVCKELATVMHDELNAIIQLHSSDFPENSSAEIKEQGKKNQAEKDEVKTIKRPDLKDENQMFVETNAKLSKMYFLNDNTIYQLGDLKINTNDMKFEVRENGKMLDLLESKDEQLLARGTCHYFFYEQSSRTTWEVVSTVFGWILKRETIHYGEYEVTRKFANAWINLAKSKVKSEEESEDESEQESCIERLKFRFKCSYKNLPYVVEKLAKLFSAQKGINKIKFTAEDELASFSTYHDQKGKVITFWIDKSCLADSEYMSQLFYEHLAMPYLEENREISGYHTISDEEISGSGKLISYRQDYCFGFFSIKMSVADDLSKTLVLEDFKYEGMLNDDNVFKQLSDIDKDCYVVITAGYIELDSAQTNFFKANLELKFSRPENPDNNSRIYQTLDVNVIIDGTTQIRFCPGGRFLVSSDWTGFFNEFSTRFCTPDELNQGAKDFQLGGYTGKSATLGYGHAAHLLNISTVSFGHNIERARIEDLAGHLKFSDEQKSIPSEMLELASQTDVQQRDSAQVAISARVKSNTSGCCSIS